MKILLLIIFLSCFFSCDNIDVKREKVYKITQFDKPIYDTITPTKGEYYGAKSIEVIGYTDDTVTVSFGKGYYKHFLTKKIDTVFSTDYYGDKNAIFIFQPYKAKKGNLQLKFRI
ncbi:hypothetical protein SAMN05444395_103118 [Flavobacterium fryxellicola]|uniref:Uncharacterized protein n=1 Tax=Flavobacterium fryxellicola TaxID=249352 RepID=A0A167X648_9FLAO|nr:hypothetical protein [Flavobacterium fryxellicola]OAB28052.1 hypothetical protein FBFR_09385 [Flavobacterium fryxellicola]SHN64422.1 hypothetical protein SAMN05444395_103118 [Flavobacterium fryxellicola]